MDNYNIGIEKNPSDAKMTFFIAFWCDTILLVCFFFFCFFDPTDHILFYDVCNRETNQYAGGREKIQYRVTGPTRLHYALVRN
jgi:hypothetical protein